MLLELSCAACSDCNGAEVNLKVLLLPSWCQDKPLWLLNLQLSQD